MQTEIEVIAQRVASIATRRMLPGLDRDDLRQVARIAAWQAESRFDPARGVSLGSYVATSVRWALANEMRDRDHLPRSLRACANRILTETGEAPGWAAVPVALEDVLEPRAEEDPAELALARVEAAHLDAALARLPAREREVIVCHFWQGQTCATIGAGLGIGKGTVWRILQAGLCRLRVLLG